MASIDFILNELAGDDSIQSLRDAPDVNALIQRGSANVVLTHMSYLSIPRISVSKNQHRTLYILSLVILMLWPILIFVEVF